MHDERGSHLPSPVSSCRNVHRANVLKTGFTGIWSIVTSTTLGPSARTGHFTVYDDSTHRAFVGYGLTVRNTPLFDLWCLDALSLTWRNIPLIGEVLSGRSGTKAVLLGSHIVLFGGYSEPTYFSDLHTININSGEVKVVSTVGQSPSPRSTPILAIYSNRLYVWGGFNGDWPTELSVLEFSDMSWRQYEQDVAGRTAIPSVIYNNMLFSYGSSKSAGMLVLNLDTFQITTRPTTGSEPPSSVMGSGMAQAGKYAFFFGGRANSPTTLMYACDLTTLWWFVFHVMADGETVSVADGSVSELGLFMLPRIHSFSMCYVKETRQIMAFLGAPEKDPPPLFIVAIGEALSIITLREDMVAALKMSEWPI
jgi:hypothetical protein